MFLKRMQNNLLFVMLLILSACGFQLRGQLDLPDSMKYVYIDGDASVVFTRHLRQALERTGAQLVENIDAATAVLAIQHEQQQRNVISVSEAARVREYESFYSLGFSLRETSGKQILEPQILELRRDFSFLESEVLAKEREEARLVRDMQSEAVQVILRKIRYAQTRNDQT